MAISVMTNVASLNGQRNLTASSATLGKALNRLSSGLRINSASDDAAGLAISTGMNAQVKGLNQAIRNAGDGLSLLGTAEGAMVEQTNILQRMRELAVQSGSDTNNASNRQSINEEATQLKNELDRIAKTSSFNGVNLLDGSFTGKELQIGANSSANERLTMALSGTKATDLGAAFKMSGTATTAAALTDGGITIASNGVTTNIGASTADGVSPAAGADSSALAHANAINAKFAQTNVSASASTSFTAANVVSAGSISAGDLTINGTDIGAVAGVTADEAGALKVATAINTKSATTGVQAATNGAGKLVLTAADGRNIVFGGTDAASQAKAGLSAGQASSTVHGTLSLSSAGDFTLGGTQATTVAIGIAGAKATQSTTENVSTIDLTSKSGANTALGIIDTALSNMNSIRSKIGAQTNRLNSVVSSLSTAAENTSASNSRILDADFAQETASMSRSQILQQAGVAVLAQANQSPQLALSLLR